MNTLDRSINAPKPRFSILIAEHYGMCFGVRKAIQQVESLLEKDQATILGQLAHNPDVERKMSKKGAMLGSLKDQSAKTKNVVISAHGASDQDRFFWKNSGYRVTDTTCPLVHKAHQALSRFVNKGYQGVIIGKQDHIEVNGLIGDFPGTVVIKEEAEIFFLPPAENYGIIAQTTHPIHHALHLVQRIEELLPKSKVHFTDTVCQPTKDRQRALYQLSQQADFILAVGGKNSNNTAKLVSTAQAYGRPARHIEHPSEIDPSWFDNISTVGVTAGTSTTQESVDRVISHLHQLSNNSTNW